MGKLLIADDTGRVLRCDDTVQVSQRYLDVHPHIVANGVGRYLVGPDAEAQLRGITNRGDFVVLEQLASVGGQVTLQKIEE